VSVAAQVRRCCVVLQGTAVETREAALRMLASLADEAVAWIGDDCDVRFTAVSRRGVAGLLGRAFDAVVIDAHAGFDADVLGQAHGLVWGGGVLVLRRPPIGVEPALGAARRLAVTPYTEADVTRRFERHVERMLEPVPAPVQVEPIEHVTAGTTEQRRVVDAIASAWRVDGPSRIVVTADRGRGKSAALGLALARSGIARAAVTAAHVDAVREVLRFADVPFVPLPELLRADARFDVIVVDEAAQVPVPALQRLVQRHAAAHLAFATTTHGYEGTGRGFALRFMEWLERGTVPVQRFDLHAPIRWAHGDPLERMIFAALLLDCELPDVGAVEDVELVQLDRDALVADLPRLREFFGLLVHAHYRTTPGDLHRLLDAPNLRLHAVLARGRVVAATVVAEEGSLPPALCEAVARGTTRLNGHALADALVAHLGHVDAGRLRMLRSVRIAVHPGLRRRGLASRLVEHVHRSAEPELFGTMFGATADLIAFRRRLGYEVVRISASRGTRTGEPAVMMLRPVTAAAHALLERLRHELARELPVQLQLLQADDELTLDPDLVTAVTVDLPAPTPLTDAEALALAEAYAFGPRTFESCATAVARTVDLHRDRLPALDPTERTVVQSRVIARRGWLRTTTDARLPTVRAAMRTLRHAVRELVRTSTATR
jgi:tRNA(Met) cytidine acetyltransferase